MILKNIKLVIFDLDGVLLDTERISTNCWMEAFEKFGYRLDFDVAAKEIGSNNSNRESYYKDLFGNDLPYGKIKDLYSKTLFESIKNDKNLLKKGAIEILDYLDLKKIKKAVASSSCKERVTESLKAANIFDRFDMILSGDDVDKCKPDPEVHIKICQQLKVNINDAIIIEDSDIGAEAAYNANIKYVLIPDLKKIPSNWINRCYAVKKNLYELFI
ncbi:MAG TPA: HAD family phosphatase [Sedimentibacter sp.]|jgi:HAD superfamily hydrolase (TIGR01509 family)|nr:HAD family phosphatase [Pseudobacteroides sp.]HRC81044.1 HAD family phosphatase [Sedimentibacter sp.]